jgi:hypothetical protein
MRVRASVRIEHDVLDKRIKSNGLKNLLTVIGSNIFSLYAKCNLGMTFDPDL